jgi:hypothetical protein
MNAEQMTTFIHYAQIGVACDLNHRYEWYVNALRSTHHGPYTKITEETQAIQDAFLAFEKGATELASMTLNDYLDLVNAWYKRGKQEGWLELK